MRIIEDAFHNWSRDNLHLYSYQMKISNINHNKNDKKILELNLMNNYNVSIWADNYYIYKNRTYTKIAMPFSSIWNAKNHNKSLQ